MNSNSQRAIPVLVLAFMIPTISLSADDDFVYQTVAVTNQAVPGLPGTLIDAISAPPEIGESSQVLFKLVLTGAGIDASNDDVLLAGRKNHLTIVYREGDTPPGFAGSVQFHTATALGMDGDGDSAFFAEFTGPGVNPTSDSGLFRTVNGELQTYVVEGDSAPGAGGGVEFDDLFNARLGRGGHFAFGPRLAGPGVNADNNRAVYSEQQGMPVLMVREGDQIPDAPAGLLFEGVFPLNSLN